MGKIIQNGFLIFFLCSCSLFKASKPKEVMGQNYEMFYSNVEEKREELVDLNDEFINVLNRDSCFDNWGEKIYDLKEKLKNANQKEKPFLWFRLGNCYNYVGDFKLALFYYNLVESSNTRDTKIQAVMLANLAEIYKSQGQEELAFSYFENSIKLDDPSQLSLFEQALLLSKWGQYKESLKLLKELNKRFPESKLIIYLIGVQYFLLEDFDFVKSKVLNSLDEQYIGAQLLKSALLVGTITRETKENFLSELDDLNSPLKYFEQFRLLIRQKVKI